LAHAGSDDLIGGKRQLPPSTPAPPIMNDVFDDRGDARAIEHLKIVPAFI
jgi:hypothetical protein